MEVKISVPSNPRFAKQTLTNISLPRIWKALPPTARCSLKFLMPAASRLRSPMFTCKIIYPIRRSLLTTPPTTAEFWRWLTCRPEWTLIIFSWPRAAIRKTGLIRLVPQPIQILRPRRPLSLFSKWHKWVFPLIKLLCWTWAAWRKIACQSPTSPLRWPAAN